MLHHSMVWWVSYNMSWARQNYVPSTFCIVMLLFHVLCLYTCIWNSHMAYEWLGINCLSCLDLRPRFSWHLCVTAPPSYQKSTVIIWQDPVLMKSSPSFPVPLLAYIRVSDAPQCTHKLARHQRVREGHVHVDEPPTSSNPRYYFG